MNRQMELQSLYAAHAGAVAGAYPRRWSHYRLWLWWLLGLVLIVGGGLFTALMLAPWPEVLHHLLLGHTGLVLAVIAAYAVAGVVIEKTSRFPGWTSVAVVLPAVTGAFLVLVCVLLVGRFYYSRSFLLSAYCLSVAWLTIGMYLRYHYLVPRLALVPEGKGMQLASVRGAHWRVLVRPSLADMQADGVVVDLHAQLSDAWLRFVADCALHRVPVYHSDWVYESLTGRTSLDRASDGFMSSLDPSRMYLLGKRTFDVVAAVAALPVIVPLTVVVALCIKLDTSGPVFFIQERVGQSGRVFRLLKFRSMCVQSESSCAKFADQSDPRITRVGARLRKWRLDELPQVFNVLLGHMSFVGPRPEQVDFVRDFESQIPFYAYRHIVRPGITGWAQVTQGYTADMLSTAEKLERDIYYIRHMSFWLEFTVLVRTLRILITGFGAR